MGVKKFSADFFAFDPSGNPIAMNHDVMEFKLIDRDESDEVLDGCPLDPSLIESLKAIRRIDQSYETLEMLVMQLGSIRQERKSA